MSALTAVLLGALFVMVYVFCCYCRRSHEHYFSEGLHYLKHALEHVTEHVHNHTVMYIICGHKSLPTQAQGLASIEE